MYGYIYITENLINHKKYIGQHCSDHFDFNYKGSGRLLLRAIKKYGWENFSCKILESDGIMPTICNSKEELGKAEEYYVNLYNAQQSNEYYNLKAGGIQVSVWSSYSEEEYERHREICRQNTIGENNPNYGNHTLRDRLVSGELIPNRLGIPHTEEYKKRLSKSMKSKKIHSGSSNPFYGKKHSKEAKKKQSEWTKARHWYNNGEREVFELSCPDGYVKGRLKRKK